MNRIAWSTCSGLRIQALQRLEISRRKTLPYTKNGVQYLNEQVCSKYYDKEKKSENALAQGILRQEITLRKAAIKRLIDQKRPTLKDITVELILDALEGDLKVLGLYGRSIGTYNSALKLLCDKYGQDAGLHYFGILAAKVEFPSLAIVASESGMHPRSLDRRLKKIVGSWTPLTLTGAIQPLPPLVIDRKAVMSQAENQVDSCYCHEVIGDTNAEENGLIGSCEGDPLCQN